jgi:hypothetical protein
MKQTPEERKENQRASQKRYKENMSPEMKAKITESKRVNAAKRRDVAKVERAACYQKNKVTMDLQVKMYMQKQRDIAKAQARKVRNQPADTTTLKDEAKKMGIATAHLRTISKDERFNMPKHKMIRIDGIELYDIYELSTWQQKYREMLAQETISGIAKNKKGITIAPHVILITNWLQASKHVTKYCNKQRVAINSNQFWARWA